MKIAHDPNEIIAVVDENDKVIGEATRKEIHQNGLIHRETAVYIINSNNHVLIQRRADNHLWDTTCSGHFPVNQSYLDAAVRETKEELGLNIKKNILSSTSRLIFSIMQLIRMCLMRCIMPRDILFGQD